MAKGKKGATIRKVTTFATSGYRGGQRAATDPKTGKVGRGGKFITHDQRYRDMRAAFGMSTG